MTPAELEHFKDCEAREWIRRLNQKKLTIGSSKALLWWQGVCVDLDLPVDLLVGYKGHTFLVEIKTDSKKRLTKLQADFFENWSGSTLARIDCPEAALRMIGVVK